MPRMFPTRTTAQKAIGFSAKTIEIVERMLRKKVSIAWIMGLTFSGWVKDRSEWINGSDLL
jgi:hypothetical protein